MASAARSLTEPQVLAHTKRRLFPDDADDGYAVVDTQFAADRWLADGAIDSSVTELLAPFNHVRVGSGYPDLVGVRVLDPDLLAVDRLGEEPPLVAVEAKGYDDRGGVDVERGVVQAYDRLDEANAVYVAAPVASIGGSVRTLARELNVGVLAVDADGAVDAVEVPRVVGNRTTSETTAIRFQASAQGVADKSFGLNHPKNYLAYPLALYHPDETERVLSEHVVRAVDAARTGAAFLNLVEERPDGVRLTPLGKEVVRFALAEYGSVESALAEFDEWKRSRRRFSDIAPKWGLLTRRVVYAYPATQLLVEELQRLHEDGVPEPTLPQVVEYLHELHPSFTVELFVRGDDDVRGRVLDADGELQRAALTDGDVYHAPTVFQLKAMLYHAGILTTRGTEPSNLDPTADTWALREQVSPTGGR
ncbi:hypothetical protein [Halobaculum magnesiiphilum]|uniref:Uncharacterized protein n=1 Tax=Halobaculum magnesiiphilum TaxID=1017351 RepID=A0A8T8WF66_9EURY|nr:hypothetical protein [Halobaculum magnesiiphilum]QZP38495.1 hypothetical protein K6T50_04965 [Halobaculum magnesiiphilum]